MEKKIFDFIIIGGGPTGSTTGTLLAREGFKVLILEKEKFPRDHVGESLIPFCHQVFEDLGVLEKMKSRFSRKPGVTFSNIEGSQSSHWCFNRVIKDSSYLSFHVRRAQFDEMLLEHSIETGAEVKQETKVTDIDFESNKNTVIIEAEGTDRTKERYQTKFLIDASGQDTFLGRKMKSKEQNARMKRRIAFSTHWVDLNYPKTLKDGNLQIVQLEGSKLGWVWIIPISDNRASIGVVVNMDYAKNQKKEILSTDKNWQETLYLNELNTSPIIKNIIKEGHTVLPIAVNGDYSYWINKKYGDRFAIIGDAAAFLDPIFSSGIYLGIRSAQLVTNGLIEKFRHQNDELLEQAYTDIEGAYQLIEKLINTFYEPNSIRFSEAQHVLDDSYEKFESAYSILHLILAGDFFKNYKKYLKAIEIMSDAQMIKKFKNLIYQDNTQAQKLEGCLAKDGSIFD